LPDFLCLALPPRSGTDPLETLFVLQFGRPFLNSSQPRYRVFSPPFAFRPSSIRFGCTQRLNCVPLPPPLRTVSLFSWFRTTVVSQLYMTRGTLISEGLFLFRTDHMLGALSSSSSLSVAPYSLVPPPHTSPNSSGGSAIGTFFVATSLCLILACPPPPPPRSDVLYCGRP